MRRWRSFEWPLPPRKVRAHPSGSSLLLDGWIQGRRQRRLRRRLRRQLHWPMKAHLLEPKGVLLDQPPAGYGQREGETHAEHGIGEEPPAADTPQVEQLLHGKGVGVDAIRVVVP